MTGELVSADGALVERVRLRLLADTANRHGPAEVAEAVRAEAGIADAATLERIGRAVAAQMLGVGPLEPLVALSGVTDVLVNGAGAVWIDRGCGLERTAVGFADDRQVRLLAQRLVAAAGRRLDDAMPYADAMLPDGTRLHAVLPPITAVPTLSLRLFSTQRRTLDDLTVSASVPVEVAAVLRAVVAARLAFVISGGTGAGKTTLLACMLAGVPPSERIVTVEDAPELDVAHPHVVRLAARTANVEGAGAVSVRDLVRQSLRMRPDRLVVGEFRGAEVADLLVALNTGHDGGAATVHANSAAAVPSRLIALGGLAGVAPVVLGRLAGAALQVVVHLQRVSGLRSVAEIALLVFERDELTTVPVWTSPGGFGPGSTELARRCADRGVVPAWAGGAR